MRGDPCPVAGCTKTCKYRRLCEMHYARLRRYGSLEDPRQSLTERFWSKVHETDTCWMWTASQNPHGYGQFGLPGDKKIGAHRLAYQLLVGPIPDGLVLDHLCRVRACVNPAHLEPVTNAENLRRGEGFVGKKFRQTHCIHGHEFTPANTRITKRGTRTCRVCDRIQAAQRRAAA